MTILAFLFMAVSLCFSGIVLAWMLVMVLDRVLMIKEEPLPILDTRLDCGLCQCCGEQS